MKLWGEAMTEFIVDQCVVCKKRLRVQLTADRFLTRDESEVDVVVGCCGKIYGRTVTQAEYLTKQFLDGCLDDMNRRLSL